MQGFVVKSGQGDYSVEFQPDLEVVVNRLSGVLNPAVVIDRIVAGLYRDELSPITDRFPTLFIDATEEEKSLDGAGKVCAWLQEQNATKQTTLVAIGGGITQDIAAFSAHIYYRGLRWVYVPTTLLAMSDSCIGAKCCINHRRYKNQLGAFHAPWQVHLCTQFLDTLGNEAVASGYGEILKLMFTGSRDHLARLIQTVTEGGLRNDELTHLLRESLEVKKAVIEVDEYEKDLRRILNYGHTFGHALETLTAHTVPHGLAVAWGMDLVNYIARQRGMLGESDFQRVHDFVREHLYCPLVGEISTAALIATARRDKKVADGQVNLILAEKPGSLRVVRTPFDAQLETQIRDYLENINVFAPSTALRRAA
jgi:3-dehydroquinate synthase